MQFYSFKSLSFFSAPLILLLNSTFGQEKWYVIVDDLNSLLSLCSEFICGFFFASEVQKLYV